MNRAEKRRQQKLAKKKARRGKATVPQPSAAVHDMLQGAMAHHSAGRLDAAEPIYRDILDIDPEMPDALHLLGALRHQQGDHATAVSLIQKAITYIPNFAEVHANLGAAQRALGQLDAAAASLETALGIDPGQTGARFNLGNTYIAQGRLDDAAGCYRKVLAEKPDFVEAHNNLGNALKEQGDLDGAAAAYEAALGINPAYAEAHNNLGTIHLDRHAPAAAESSFRRAIAMRKDYAHAHNNLGTALMAQGRNGDARKAFRDANAVDPEYAEAHVNLGVALKADGDLAAAQASYEKALALDLGYAAAHYNLGIIREELGDWRAADALYDKAISLAPANAGWRVRKARLLPVIPASDDEIAAERARVLAAVDDLLSRDLTLSDPPTEVGASTFYLAYHDRDNREIIEKMARLYLKACPDLAYTAAHCEARPDPAKSVLRIGILSTFLVNHTIGKLLAGLIERLPRDRFEVVVLRPAGQDDEMVTRIDAAADQVVKLANRLGPDRATIAGLELDILFYPDIGMDPYTYFLAFARLAPLQAVSLGHPETTGIPNLDCFVSSVRLEPDGAQDHYTERLVLLPDPPTFYARPPVAAGAFDRADYALSADDNLYAVPQALFKFHPDFDRVLGDILARDDAGRVVLIEDTLGGAWRDLLTARFRAAFPGAADRVVFLPRLDSAQFTGMLADADAVLDIPSFSGGHSSVEAFAAGAPIVTWPSGFMRGRVTAALYDQMGLDTLVAADAEEYVDLALRLARDDDFKAEMRAAIADRAERIFISDAGVAAMADAFAAAYAEKAGA